MFYISWLSLQQWIKHFQVLFGAWSLLHQSKSLLQLWQSPGNIRQWPHVSASNHSSSATENVKRSQKDEKENSQRQREESRSFCTKQLQMSGHCEENTMLLNCAAKLPLWLLLFERIMTTQRSPSLPVSRSVLPGGKVRWSNRKRSEGSRWRGLDTAGIRSTGYFTDDDPKVTNCKLTFIYMTKSVRTVQSAEVQKCWIQKCWYKWYSWMSVWVAYGNRENVMRRL